MLIRSLLLPVSLPFLAFTSVVAETTTPSFSEGFRMLNALGHPLPTTEPIWSKTEGTARHISGPLNELSQAMNGNGWRLPHTDENPHQVIRFGELVPVEIEASETSPEPANLEEDVARIIETVSKLAPPEDVDDFRRSWNDAGSRTFGPLMIFAAQLHHSGKPALADQLAWALFQSAPNREVVIDAAVNHLGDARYNDAANRLFDNWNWQTFHDEITTLIHKLPRGWDMHPAVAMVADSVALHLANPTPPPPSLDDQEISQKAIDAIAWMSAAPEQNDETPAIPPDVARMLEQVPPEYHARFLESRGLAGGRRVIPQPGFWLIAPPDEANNSAQPASPVLALGIDAFPVLAALANDPHPVHFNNPAARDHHHSYSHNPLEKAMQTHAHMHRPATRGDIARLLLTSVLPDAGNNLRNADPDTIRDIALDFHNTHKKKNAGQLAAVFINDGDESQKSHAARFLATSEDPDHHALFESSVVESLPAVANLPSVLIYAQQRKTDAKPFINRYLPLVREEIGDGSNLENMRELSWELRESENLKQILRQLEALADGKSAEDSAREIAAAPPEEAEAAIHALLQSISSSTPAEQISALLTGASTASNPQTRFQFISHLFHISNHDDTGEEEDAEKNAPPTIPEDLRDSWATLIKDDRPIDPQWNRDGWVQEQGTLATHAALAAEYLVDQSAFYEISQLTGILKTTLGELALARIKARLAGDPLPTLPNPENVTPDRLREIITAAGEKSPAEIPAYLDTLSPDDRAAWFFWIQDPGEIPVPESVRNLAMTIVEENTALENGLQPTPGLLNLTPGLTFHKDTIEGYIQTLAANSATHSLCFGTIQPIDFPPGLKSWTIRAAIPKDEDEEDEDETFMSATPIRIFQNVAYYFQADGVPDGAESLIVCQYYDSITHENNVFNWWVIDAKPVPFAISNRGEITDEIETTITETLSAAYENATPFMLHVQVITRADAERLADN